MPILPQAAQENATHDASTVIVASKTVPDQFFGTLTFELIGELSGTPATTYSYTNKAIVSCDLGLVTVQYQGTPEIIDPASAAPTVTIDASGQNVQLKVLGFAAQDWRWAGKISGLERTEWNESVMPLLAQAQVWYEADFTAAQGTVIDATGEPQLFTTIPNRGLVGGTFGGAGVVRPKVGNIESNDNLRRVVSFDGSNNYHTSSSGASSFTYRHDGTGCTEFSCILTIATAANQSIANTCTPASATGTLVRVFSMRPDLLIYSGATARIFLQSSINVVSGIPSIITTQNGSSLTPNAILRLNGVQTASANYGGALDTGAPSRTLEIGYSAGAQVWNGQICAHISYNRLLTTAEIVLIENYLAQKYCRPSAIMRQAPTVWLNPALANATRLDPAAAPTAVDRVWDASGKAHDASQTTDANDPLLTTTSGQKSLDYDGSASYMRISAGTAWSANTGATLVTVVDPDLVSIGGSQILDAATGREIFSSTINTSIERTGWHDGAYKDGGRAMLGAQLLRWQLPSGGGTGNMYRGGKLIGSATYTAVSLAGQVNLGSSIVPAQFFNGRIADLIERDTQITGTSLWEVLEYLNSKYGFTWHSSLIPDHVSIIDPRVSDSVTTAGGSVSRVNSQHANIDVVADGSCEAAGVTAWTARNSAALSKTAVSPFAGTLALRITGDGVHTFPAARQTILTASNTYRVKCQMRSDGATIPLLVAGATTVWTGIAGAGWQAVDVTFVNGVTTTLDWQFAAASGTLDVDAVEVIDVTAGAATQGTGANQPTHDAVNGKLQFAEASTQFLIEEAPTAVATGCCYYGWVNFPAPSGVHRTLWGVTDGTKQVEMRYAATSGILESVVSAGNVIDADVVPSGWVFVSQCYGTALHILGKDGQFKMSTAAVTVPALAMYLGGRNNSGAGCVEPMTMDLGYRGKINRVPTIRELMRIREQTRPAAAAALPAAMVPADWDSQLCGCWDPSVTTAGGPVSAWADRLARPGMGATSPGAASTYPQHSVIDNSVAYDGVDDGMLWVVPPSLTQGSIELWFYLPAIPGGTVYLCGTFVTAGQTLSIGVTAGTLFLRAGLSTDPVLLGPTMTVGWHHCVATFVNGGARVLTADGITSVSTCNSAVPNQNLELGGLLLDGAPSLRTNCRIAKISIKSSVISVAQAVSNFVTDYDTIVNKVGV